MAKPLILHGRSRLRRTDAETVVSAVFTMVFTGFAFGILQTLLHYFAPSVESAAPTVLAIPLAYFVASFVPTRISVGDDGVLVAWIGKSQFVPYSDIARVEPQGADACLVLTSGDSRFLSIGQKSIPTPGDKRDALIERIEKGRVAYRRWGSARDVEALVERGARDAESWMRALRGLLDQESYRTVTLDPELLWRVVEDPSARPSARVGAVVALGRWLDRVGRHRLRQAAVASASPRLRVALEVASTPDVTRGKLERAVRDLEEQSVEGHTGAAKRS
jgi:hypothetical protein